MTGSATICVVDDDAAVRDSIEALLASEGFEVRSYPTATEFLAAFVSPYTHNVTNKSGFSITSLSGSRYIPSVNDAAQARLLAAAEINDAD